MSQFAFKYIKRSREQFTELIEGLHVEQLNRVLPGYRNNIAWNFGHIVVSTLALCYVRTGVRPDAKIPFFDTYTRGTVPEKWINGDELAVLKQLAVSSILEIEEDMANHVFSGMKPYATATYGFEMHSIEEVVTCTLAHDNLHLGYATSIRRALEGWDKKS